MTEPRRFLDDDSAHPFSRSLLESATDDGIERERLAELVRSAAAKASTGSSATPAVSSSRRLLLAKAPFIAALSLLAGAVVWSRVEVQRPVSAPPRAPQVLAQTANEMPPEPVAPSPAPSASAEAFSVDQLPNAPIVATSARPAAPTSRPVGIDADRLMEEVRALERVSAAIARGDTAAARSNLTSYERSFPKQLLASEARFLEIEILVAEGRHDEARARARTYLASWPESPYAARVRSLVTP